MQQIGLRYGGIAALVLIAIQLVSHLAGLAESPNMAAGIGMWVLSFGITFYFVYLANKTWRDEVNGGGMSIGEGIKMGVLIGLIAGALLGLYTVLIHQNFIDPDMLTRQMDMQREAWENAGMSDEQIEQSEKWGSMMFKPYILIPTTIIMYVIGGLLKGLISGAILKQDPTPIV